MKTRLLFLLAATALLSLSFTQKKSVGKKVKSRPCEITVQFSPTISALGFCGIDNCNGSASTSSIAANTTWTPMLVGTGCTSVNITTSFPTFHPAGTVNIYKNGVLVLSHVVTKNQSIVFDDNLAAACDDFFLVSW